MNTIKRKLKKSGLVLLIYRTLMQGIAVLRGPLARQAASPYKIRKVKVPGYRNTFCGYYDFSPFSLQNPQNILVHANQARAWLRPKGQTKTDIFILNWRDERVVKKVGETFSWNWQQGARALWLNEEEVIYNVYNRFLERYESVVYNLRSESEEVIPIPVQAVDCHGRIYSISYEALNLIRPDYGYRNKRIYEGDLFKEELQVFCRRKGEIKTLLKIEDLVKITHRKDGEVLEKPKINHVLPSPAGSKVIFLFRYYLSGIRKTDVYMVDPIFGDLVLLLSDCAASHYAWINDFEIIITKKGSAGFGYYKLNIINKENELVLLYEDGHPCMFNEKFFVSDTYPSKKGAFRHLIFLPYSANRTKYLYASFPEPVMFHGESRCDLHPSLSGDGRWIQVDMAENSRRCIAILEAPLL